MTTFYLAVEIDDNDRQPNVGEPFYVSNAHYETTHVSGLTGHVLAAVGPYEEALLKMHASIYPERYPPGHPLHDPTHMYWDNAPKFKTVEELRDMSDDELVLYYDECLPNEPTGFADEFWNSDERKLTEEQRSDLIDAIVDDQSEEVEDLEPFQWDSETIEWVAADLNSVLAGHPLANTK